MLQGPQPEVAEKEQGLGLQSTGLLGETFSQPAWLPPWQD